MAGIIPIWKLNRSLLPRHDWPADQLISWSRQYGLLHDTNRNGAWMCSRHSSTELRYHQPSANRPLGKYCCSKSKCNRGCSVRFGSWFAGSKLTIPTIISLTYSYSWDESYLRAIHEGSNSLEANNTEISSNTVADWYSHCRELVVSDFIAQEKERGQIGGLDGDGNPIIVQIDASKFGRSKYCGSRIDGQWVLGMIANGSDDLRLRFCEGNVCDAATLLPIIQEHVAPGSEIHTDMWRAYDGLEELGYIHRRVNHSDPDNPFVANDGVHTQRIAANWRPFKIWSRGHHVSGNECADRMVEYGWRRRIRLAPRPYNNPFGSMLELISRQYNFKQIYISTTA